MYKKQQLQIVPRKHTRLQNPTPKPKLNATNELVKEKNTTYKQNSCTGEVYNSKTLVLCDMCMNSPSTRIGNTYHRHRHQSTIDINMLDKNIIINMGNDKHS